MLKKMTRKNQVVLAAIGAEIVRKLNGAQCRQKNEGVSMSAPSKGHVNQRV